jgi:hypothetical protein
MSIRPSAWNSWGATGQIFMKFEYFSNGCAKEVSKKIKDGKNKK